MSYATLLTTLYLFFNTFCLLAYIPQIRLYFQSRAAREGLALSTWSIWLFGAFIEFLYAMQSQNIPWSLMALGHVLACAVVVWCGVMDRLKTRSLVKTQNQCVREIV